MHQGACLEYPVHCLITRIALEEEETDVLSDAASKGSEEELSSLKDKNSDKENLNIEKHVILHPIICTYTTLSTNISDTSHLICVKCTHL